MVSNRVLFSIICELLWLIEYKLFTNITNIQIFDCKTAKSNFALQKIEYSWIVTNNWNSINGEYELLYCVFWRPLAVFIRRGMVCSFSATPCTYRKTYRCTNKQSDGLIINRSVYNPQQPPISRRHIAARNLQSATQSVQSMPILACQILVTNSSHVMAREVWKMLTFLKLN